MCICFLFLLLLLFHYAPKQTQSAGIDVCAVLGYPPDWASSRPAPENLAVNSPETSNYCCRAGRYVSRDIKAANGTLGDGRLWRDYVYQVMSRYAGTVKYFEIVNEVNFRTEKNSASFSGTAEEYF